MGTHSTNFAGQTLARFAPFDLLADTALAALAASARIQRLARNEMLVHRGDCPHGLYLLVEGELKLFLISSGGAERILRVVRGGDTFCEDSAFGSNPQMLAAQTTRESLVLFIPTRTLRDAMLDCGEFAEALLERLSERMCDLLSGMEQCEQRNSAQRVAHYLVKHAREKESALEVELASNKQTIASQLNMTPESFSRVLSRFAREGFIHSRGHRAIRLTDYSGLRSLAA